MNKGFLFLLGFIFFSWSSFAAAWPLQRVTGIVSFRFPAAPQYTTVSDLGNYLYQADSCSFLVQSRPYRDGIKVHDSLTLDAFYDGIAKGILKAAKGTVVHKQMISVLSLRALEVQYVKGNENARPITVCSRALLINGDVIIYSFTAPYPVFDQFSSLKTQFQSSLTFAPDSTLYQYRPLSPADSIATVAAIAPVRADTVTKAVAVPAPLSLMDSHTGAIIRLFGLLILLSAVIYFFATLSRRKG